MSVLRFYQRGLVLQRCRQLVLLLCTAGASASFALDLILSDRLSNCCMPPMPRKTTPLGLAQAYDAALEQDAVIRAARAAADASRERLPQAVSQQRPNLSFSVMRAYNRLEALNPSAAAAVQGSQSDYASHNQSLNLRQSIYNGVKSSDVEQAGFQVTDAEELLLRERQSLALRVAESYFGVLLAQDHLALLSSQEALVRTQLDAAQDAFAAGAGTRTDIDEVQARLDMNTAQMLEAQLALGYARQQLALTMNQPVQELAPLEVGQLRLTPPQPQDIAQWHALVDQHSPELRALEARREVARLQIDKNQSGHLPTLDLMAQWSVSDSENVTRLNSSYDTRLIGLQLSVPLFAGGYVSSTVRQAVAEHVRATELLEVARRDLRRRIYKEFGAVSEGILRVRALEQAVRSAEQVVVSSRYSAQAGLRTQLDVLKADAQRLESMRDLAQARYGFVLSKLRLRVLAGLADREDIAEIDRLLAVSTGQ